MLNLKIEYFLNEKGYFLFKNWYEQVLSITSIQPGFVNMYYNIIDKSNIFIYLSFESQEKLDKWIENHEHKKLESQIEKYFNKLPEVKLI